MSVARALPYDRPRRQTAAAAVAAAAVSGLLLVLLAAPPPMRPPTVATAPPPAVVYLQPPPPQPAQASPPPVARPVPPPPRREARTRLREPERPVQPQAITVPATVPAAVPDTAPPTVAEAPPAAASAPPPPLRLGPEVMRRAARDSLDETRRLAAEAGTPLDIAHSANQKLADAVKESGKPDCIGPDAGGSLLSIPVIAYKMLTQHCR